MRYSVTNDKRNNVECSLYLISCLICCVIEIFVFSKITFANESLQTIWIIFQCAFSLSPVAIVALLKWIASKFLLKIVKIENLSGIYKVCIESNYKGKTTFEATIQIKQTFDNININFSTDKSSSRAINAQLDNSGIYTKLYYTYINEGDATDKKNKTHVGTCTLTFINKRIEGNYYNNSRDRQTYGSIKSIK